MPRGEGTQDVLRVDGGTHRPGEGAHCGLGRHVVVGHEPRQSHVPQLGAAPLAGQQHCGTQCQNVQRCLETRSRVSRTAPQDAKLVNDASKQSTYRCMPPQS